PPRGDKLLSYWTGAEAWRFPKLRHARSSRLLPPASRPLLEGALNKVIWGWHRYCRARHGGTRLAGEAVEPVRRREPFSFGRNDLSSRMDAGARGLRGRGWYSCVSVLTCQGS